jgi:hypothetical protein
MDASEWKRLAEHRANLVMVLKRITHQTAILLDDLEHPSPAAISAVHAARAVIAEAECISR